MIRRCIGFDATRARPCAGPFFCRGVHGPDCGSAMVVPACGPHADEPGSAAWRLLLAAAVTLQRGCDAVADVAANFQQRTGRRTRSRSRQSRARIPSAAQTISTVGPCAGPPCKTGTCTGSRQRLQQRRSQRWRHEGVRRTGELECTAIKKRPATRSRCQENRGESGKQDMEARVGIEPAYTALQAAA